MLIKTGGSLESPLEIQAPRLQMPHKNQWVGSTQEPDWASKNFCGLEIGGPEKFDMTAWIKLYAAATYKNYEIVADVNALYSGAPLTADTLVPETAVFLGKTKYAAWIAMPENQR